MITVFEGNSADEVWRHGITALHQVGHVQRSRTGNTRELMHVLFSIQDPRQRWVVGRLPAMNPAFAIADAIWILCGRNDAEFVNYWNRQLPIYAGRADYYHGAYGYRLREHLHIDQLQRAYLALANNSDTRQVVLQIWDSRADFPDETGKAVNADIPCNVMSFLKIRDGALEWMQTNRSNDVFLGVPHNFVQFTTLQEVMAGWLGVELGSYNHLSDSFHLYERDVSKVSVDTEVTLLSNSDSLMLAKDESERTLRQLAEYIEQLISPDVSEQAVRSLAENSGLRSAYQNLFLVLCGECARRKNWLDLADEMSSRCTNPLLRQLWERWQTRLNFTSGKDLLDT